MPIPAQLRHLVVLMMENRSFDHLLGSLTKEGRGDVDGINDLVSYSDVHQQAQVPHRVTEPRRISFSPDPPHESEDIAHQLQEGFLRSFERRFPGVRNSEDVIGYLTRDDLPVTYFLADQFTIFDKWFCSIPTSTIPNRLYAIAGHSDGKRDQAEAIAAANVDTVFEHLQQRGVSWKVYCGVFPNTALRFNPKTPAYFERTVRLSQFYADAAAPDMLPTFSWIEPVYSWARNSPFVAPSNDDHPPSSVHEGQRLIRKVYEALRSGPHWKNSALIVVYDEHGGFADHVSPPQAEGARGDGFKTFGPRVPAILVSPFAQHQAVCHNVVDHCSILRFVCEWLQSNFNVDLSPSLFSPRVEHAGSLVDAFTATARNDSPVSATIDSPQPGHVRGNNALPGSLQNMRNALIRQHPELGELEKAIQDDPG